MAQHHSVMMYPELRLSDLEREVAEKKAAFDASRLQLVQSVRQKVKPATFLAENRKYILGSLLTLIPATRFVKNLLMPSKNGKSQKRKGWMGKAAMMAGLVGVKMFGGVAKGASKFIFRRAIKNFFN